MIPTKVAARNELGSPDLGSVIISCPPGDREAISGMRLPLIDLLRNENSANILELSDPRVTLIDLLLSAMLYSSDDASPRMSELQIFDHGRGQYFTVKFALSLEKGVGIGVMVDELGSFVRPFEPGFARISFDLPESQDFPRVINEALIMSDRSLSQFKIERTEEKVYLGVDLTNL